MEFLAVGFWGKAQVYVAVGLTGVIFLYFFMRRIRFRQEAVRNELQAGMEKIRDMLAMLQNNPGGFPLDMAGFRAKTGFEADSGRSGGNGGSRKSDGRREARPSEAGCGKQVEPPRLLADLSWEEQGQEHYRQIGWMADQGMSVTDMAEKTGIPRCEIQLVMDLRAGEGPAHRSSLRSLRVS